MSSQDTNKQKHSDPFILDYVFSSADNVFQVRPSTIGALVRDCIFVLDTNVLIAPYEFGRTEADDISRIYRALASEGRLFIPKRVAQEFAGLRSDKLSEAYNKLHQWKSKIGGLKNTNDHQCPMLEGKEAYHQMIQASNNILEAKKAYTKSLDGVLEELKEWDWTDPISLLYSELFNSSRIVSHGVDSSEDRKKMLEQMRTLYAHKIPPGYKDGAKSDEGIGDYLIWLSMLELAKSKSRNIIFVSGEEKADWAVRMQNTTLGVRPELFYFFHNSTGCEFAMISFPQFLKLQNANPSTVVEAQSAEDRRNVSDLFGENLIELNGIIANLYVEIDQDDFEPHNSVLTLIQILSNEFNSALESEMMNNADDTERDALKSISATIHRIVILYSRLASMPSHAKESEIYQSFVQRLKYLCDDYMAMSEIFID